MASNLPRVDFYVHSSSTFEPLAATACRLTDKAWQQKASRRMVIRVDDTHQATLLDELLWTFRDGAFLPHARLTDATDPAAYPILIAGSDQALPSSHRELLINLAVSTAGAATEFERVAELVDGETARLAAGRERFRRWRAVGITPQTHQL